MKIVDFRDTLDRLSDTNSRNKKKEIIREVSDNTAAISILSGSEFDDAGLGKKTVLNCVQDVYGCDINGTPTVSESLSKSLTRTGQEPSRSVEQVYDDMEMLADASGNEMKEILRELLNGYTYPEVLTHACLDDWPTGVSDTTVANALDLRDSLPFYESVVDAASAPNPTTRPIIHNAFDPMLAKSESNLPDDLSNYVGQVKLDGIRLILHISSYKHGNTTNTQDVSAFTRRRNEVTASLPELQEIDFPHGQWIIDTEVISADGSYSTTTERIGRNKENVNRETEMNFAVFDVIQFDGEPVHNEPFTKRYGYTTAFADLTPDERVGALPVHTDKKEAKNAASDYEGLIWKNTNAPYEFGKRSKAWVKEKHQSETIDVRITDIIEGQGRLTGTMGKLALETANGVNIGHVGTGFSDKQRDKIWNNSDKWHNNIIEVEAEALGEHNGLRFPRYKRNRQTGQPDTIEKIQNILPDA